MTPPAECAAVDRFWARSAPEVLPVPRDLRELLPRHFPVSIVHLPQLTSHAAATWAADRGLTGLLEPAPRRLHGCCVAYGGLAVIFIDGADPLAEQRFTLAHEAAHLLLDYLEPREEVVRSLGDEMLPVLDGDRPPSLTDRVGAVLADCPLGVYVQLLDRDSPRTAHAEPRADRFARELLAPRAALAAVPDAALEATLTDVYGLPPGQAEAYAARLRQERAPAPSFLEWLRPLDDRRR